MGSRGVDAILLAPLRHPWVAVALILLGTAACGQGLRHLEKDVRIEKVFPERDARRASYEELKEVFGRDDETAYCVLELPTSVLEPAAMARIHSLTEALKEQAWVDERRLVSLSNTPLARVTGPDAFDVGPLYDPQTVAEKGWKTDEVERLLRDHPVFSNRLLSDDRRLAGFLVPMAPGPRTEASRRAFAKSVRGFWAERLEPSERIHLDGFAITYDAVLEMLNQDVRFFYPLALVLLLIALWAVFRRVLVTVLVVITMTLAVVWTLGAMGTLGIPINFISASCIPVMLLVVCVGDAVHLVSRYRQLLAAGQAKQDALEAAVTDVGRACFFTSVTTAAGFASLLTSQIEIVRELGVPTALGVVFGYALTFLLLPPVLALAAAPQASSDARGLLAGPLERLAQAVHRHPGRVALAALVLVAGALALAPQVSTENRLLNDFDEESELLQTRLFFEQRLGGIAPVELIIDARTPGRAMDPDVQGGLLKLAHTLRSPAYKERGVLFCLGLPDFLSDAYYTWEARDPSKKGTIPLDDAGKLHELRWLFGLSGEDPTLAYMDDPDTPQKVRLQLRIRNLYTTPFFALIEQIRADAKAHLPPNVDVRITGNTLMSQAITTSLVEDMLRSFGTAFALVGLLILVFFRSVKLALLGMIPNLVPLVLVLACMAVAGVPLTVSTSIVFTVVFGISVDDTIHFVAALDHNQRRAEQDAPATADTPVDVLSDPISLTLTRTGASLILSSIVLVAGFGVLWGSNFTANRYFGALAALTIVFALLADLVLLPALLWLMRRGR